MTDRTQPPPGYRVWWDTEWSSVEWSSVEWRGELDPDLQGLDLEWSPIEPGNDWSSDEAKAAAAQGVAEAIAACWRHRDRIASETLREFAKAFRADDWARLERRGVVPTYYLSDVLARIQAFIDGLKPGPDRREP